MKAHRQVLLLFIFGAGFPLVFFSCHVRVEVEYIGATFSVERNASVEVGQGDGARTVNSTISNGLRRQAVTTQVDRHGSYHMTRRYVTSTAARGAKNAVIQKQVLELVHITKTGGTVVEVAAGRVNIKWGVCHWQGFVVGYGKGCRKPDWGKPRKRHLLRNNTPIPNFRGERWHTPPSWFVYNPYIGSATFTIVRNPYERIVSEFYCPYFGYHRSEPKPFFRRVDRKSGRIVPWVNQSNGRRNEEDELMRATLEKDLSGELQSTPRNVVKLAETMVKEVSLATSPHRSLRKIVGVSSASVEKQSLRWPTEELVQNQLPRRRLYDHRDAGVAALDDETNQVDPDNYDGLMEIVASNKAASNELLNVISVVGNNENKEEIMNAKRCKDDITFQNESCHDVANRLRRREKSTHFSTRVPLAPPTVTIFNKWIRRAVKKVMPVTGHMVPQAYYVYEETNGTTRKVVDHVLKYETLHQEFPNLMKQYGLDHVKLQPRRRRDRDRIGNSTFDVSDLDPHTICYINERYSKDFEYFGYPKIEIECDKLPDLNETDDIFGNHSPTENHTA